MKIPWVRTGTEMAADFARQYPARADEEFLIECQAYGNPNAERAALAVRRSVARFGAIAPEYIYGSHSYPGELESLSNWESLDFVGWILELEQELASPVDEAWFALYPLRFTVRDLVGIVQNRTACQLSG